MKQLTITSAEARVVPLEYRKYKRIPVSKGESKEMCTRGGNIVTVERVRTMLSGVGICDFFRITHDGKVIQPLQAKGVINFLDNN